MKYWPYAVLALLLILPLQDRLTYAAWNASSQREVQWYYDRAKPDLDKVVKYAKTNGGRVYAGMPNGWGETFRIAGVAAFHLFPVNGVPVVGFYYLGFGLSSDQMYSFDERREDHYRLYDVRTVVTPVGMAPPCACLTPGPTFGPFRLWDAPTKHWDASGAGWPLADPSHPTFYAEQAAWLRGPIPDGSGFLRFSRTFDPHWRATVDGKQAQTVILPPGFLGVPVSPGQHKVEVRYR